jgi:hypothetical protein
MDPRETPCEDYTREIVKEPNMDEHCLTLLGLSVTVIGMAWYNQEAQNPVLTAMAVVALLALWVCYRLGPGKEDDETTEDN